MEKSEFQKIEEAIKESESSLSSEDKETIESKTKILTEASQKLSELALSETQNSQPNDSSVNKEDSSTDEKTTKTDDVVDADFKEVKRD